MRHGIAGNRLNRKSSHRKATIRDLAKATLKAQRISTTKAKAKEARKLVDKLITLGKKGSLAHKRQAFSILCDHRLVSRLFNKTAPLFKNRIGGYTRIISLGNRRGDNAQLVFLELTEKEEVIITSAKTTAQGKKEKAHTASKTTDEVTEKVKTSKKDKSSAVQAEVKPTEIKPEKGKGGKNIVGGIKKIFNRKAPPGSK
ncbi:MAG: 50S ribosomal protein L17 [Candidatus Omnitrophica bacterium]|nr:50S ribosomal protein L17 [Candidatus Omnitrophota bacterium]MCB9747675.1 50S ribosomal protein L17 [Candidatus Omnitrophota bacterium]